jgi:hypothetical protein
MKREELILRIKKIVPQIMANRQKAELDAVKYDELTKFPELKTILIDLLTSDFDNFLSSIDWVAPRPTTFRINLKNDQEFYLIYGKRSWIAQVEGKKYYLLNLPEEQRAAEAISRILRYGIKQEPGLDDEFMESPDETPSPEPETPTEPEETPED